MDERKGFLTEKQEVQLDAIYKASGMIEVLDGPTIRLVDNYGLERLKKPLVEKYPDVLPIIYEIVDAIFDSLPTPIEEDNEEE